MSSRDHCFPRQFWQLQLRKIKARCWAVLLARTQYRLGISVGGFSSSSGSLANLKKNCKCTRFIRDTQLRGKKKKKGVVDLNDYQHSGLITSAWVCGVCFASWKWQSRVWPTHSNFPYIPSHCVHDGVQREKKNALRLPVDGPRQGSPLCISPFLAVIVKCSCDEAITLNTCTIYVCSSWSLIGRRPYSPFKRNSKKQHSRTCELTFDDPAKCYLIGR